MLQQTHRPAPVKARVTTAHGFSAPRGPRSPWTMGFAPIALVAVMVFAASALMLHTIVASSETHERELIASNPAADGNGAVARWIRKWRATKAMGSAPEGAVAAVGPVAAAPAAAPAAACPLCGWLDGVKREIEAAESASNSATSGAAAFVDAYVAGRRTTRQAARLLHTLATRLAEDIGSASPSLAGLAADIPSADPPPHEDDILLPEPSTSHCTQQGDSFDICEYENICFDLPGPYNHDSWDNPPEVFFVKSEVAPGVGGWKPRKKGAAGNAAQAAEDVAPALPRARGVGGAPSNTAGVVLGGDSEADRIARHRRRELSAARSEPLWNLTGMLEGRQWDSFDVVYVDVADTTVGFAPRALPWAIRFLPRLISPRETVSLANGGGYNGTVTWVDNLWVTMDMLGPHLWGFGSTTAFPIFGAWVANKTQAMHLPPIDNLLIFNTDAWKVGRFELGSPFEWADGAETKWALGFLYNLLAYVSQQRAKPWNGKTVAGKGGRYPLLDTLMDRAYVLAGKRAAPGYDGADFNGTRGEYEEVADAFFSAVKSGTQGRGSLPYEFARLQNTQAGTRILWNILDVPVPPAPYARTGTNLMRRRICTRHGVILGERPILISGSTEANAIREFGHQQLGVPHVRSNLYVPAPDRALVFDRGKVHKGGIKPRGFANLEEMLAVLTKYNVSYDLVTDRNLTRLTFEEQAQMIGQYGLVIMAHGAGETNLAFLPRRSAIIEVSPVMLWCPLYHKYLAGLGHAVFPILSRLKGPLLYWNVWTGENTTTDEAAALAAKCEGKALTNVARMQCWHEAKNAAVTTPIHEFEHVLLRALDVIGVKKFGLNSSLDLLEGMRQGGPDVPFWKEGHYEANRWKLCPPQSSCGA